jgi:PAS domain S-box-containing protein
MHETRWSSEEWLQEILQSLNDVAWSADPTTWKTLFLSQSAEVVYGRPVSEFFDNCNLWRSLIHPDDRDRVESLICVFFSREVVDLEYRIVRPSGEVRSLYHRLRLIRDANAKALRIDGIATDITEHQQAEELKSTNEELQPTLENLTSSQEQVQTQQDELITTYQLLETERLRYQELFNFAPDAYLLTDLNGTIQEVNQAAATLLSMPQGYLVGKPLIIFVTKTEYKAFLSTLMQLTQLQGMQEWEVELQGRGGLPFFAAITVGTVLDLDSKIVGLRWLIRDISDRRQIEIEILTLNAELEQRVLERTEALRLANEQLRQEIRERKQAEEKLRQSEQWFRNLVETTSDWVWELNENLVYTYVSPQVRDILGYSPQEIESKTPFGFIPARDRQRITNFFSQLLAVQEPFSCLENTSLCKNGYQVVLETSGVPVFDGNGKFCGYRGISRNITARKRMEVALRESQQKYQTLFDSLPIGISITDEQGNILEANPASEEILGLSIAEQTKRKYDAPEWQIIRPDSTPMPTSEFATVRALTENRVIKNSEMGIVKPGGEISWLSVTAAPIPLADYRIAIAYIDITERKRAEDALKQAHQRLSFHVENSPLAVIEWDSEGRLLRWSPQAEKIFGWKTQDVLGKYLYEWQFIFEEDWKTVNQRASNLWNGTVPRNVGYNRNYTKDGNVLECEWYNSALLDESGNVVSILALALDVTDRRLAEDSLRLQAEREQLMGAITQRIRQSLNLNEILNTTVEEVRQLLQNDRVVLFQLCRDGVSKVVVESTAPGLPVTVGEEFPDEVFPEEIYQYYCQGKPRIVPDIAQDEFATCITEYLQNLGVKSKLVIPILRYSQQGISYPTSLACPVSPTSSQTFLWGIMIAHDCSGHRQWQPWEIDLLCSLATQISIAIQQSELYLQLEAQLTELQQAEAALQRAKEVAEVANRTKSEFLANVSHELRTPLNGILGYTQILKQSTDLTEQQRHSISIIHQCGGHLLTLIEDILDLSKIEARKMELYPTEFHLRNFLNSLTDLFRMRAQQKGISFTYEILSPLPQAVITDQTRLRQILSNLLSNAVKFTDKGGVTLRVGYSSVVSDPWSVENKKQQTTDKLRFQIEDTGIGIEPSQLTEIFLPFHQVGDRTRATEGTGLGLAISQKLVQIMGSEIKVRSTLGEGSVFWFDLELPQVAVWDEPNQSSDHQIIGFRGDKRKVLIADDVGVNRSLLQELLKPLGFEILEAVDGQDCLNKAVESQPDLVLIDLVMPVLDGLEAIRRLRQLPQFNTMVAIALSAKVFETVKQESLAAGCQDFLPKPVQAKPLLDAIALHLGLEWIYEDDLFLTGIELHRDRVPLIPPPPSELVALSEFVKMGDIQGILEQAEQLEKLDNNLEPFATLIRQLAKGFKLKLIRELIQKYLADNQLT